MWDAFEWLRKQDPTIAAEFERRFDQQLEREEKRAEKQGKKDFAAAWKETEKLLGRNDLMVRLQPLATLKRDGVLNRRGRKAKAPPTRRKAASKEP